jgi:hypothetical protein
LAGVFYFRQQKGRPLLAALEKLVWKKEPEVIRLFEVSVKQLEVISCGGK